VRSLLVALVLTGCLTPLPPEPLDEPLYDVTVLDLDVTECTEVGQGAYEDVTAAMGVDFEALPPTEPLETDFDHVMGGGVAAVDITNDDLPDLIFTSVWGPNRVYQNRGGTFTECPDTGLEDGDRTYAVSVVDLNRDGLQDVVLLDADVVRAFENLGECRFAEVDPIHRIPNPRQRPMNIAWTDANNDGLLDAYISVRDSDPLPPKQSQPAPDVLLRGEGEFRFLDVSVQLGAIAERSGHAFASAWLDVDHDGDLDHYVANDHGGLIVPNVLFLREGPDDAPTYREAAADFSLDIEVNGMGIAVGDVDGDGWDEIGVSDTGSFVLMSTRPSLSAVDVTTAWGLQPRPTEGLASWAMEFADFDHDADLDLFVAWGWKEYDVPEVKKDDLWMWEDGTFSDRSDLLGFGGQATGRTVLPIDLNADGSLELISTSIVGRAAIQQRPCPDGSWLQVTVNLAGRNSDGLGTLVEVETPDGIQRRRLGVGSTGLHSARAPTAHFGLGSAESAEIRLILPNGDVVEVGSQDVRRRLQIHVWPYVPAMSIG
jgi:hypothetical protein